MVTKDFCDKCGKEVNYGNEWWRMFYYTIPSIGKTINLCKECKTKLKEFLTQT